MLKGKSCIFSIPIFITFRPFKCHIYCLHFFFVNYQAQNSIFIPKIRGNQADCLQVSGSAIYGLKINTLCSNHIGYIYIYCNSMMVWGSCYRSDAGAVKLAQGVAKVDGNWYWQEGGSRLLQSPGTAQHRKNFWL